jgi:hypothetical protein
VLIVRGKRARQPCIQYSAMRYYQERFHYVKLFSEEGRGASTLSHEREADR